MVGSSPPPPIRSWVGQSRIRSSPKASPTAGSSRWPQRLRWVIDVKAVTHRRDAIYQDIFVGHPDNWVLGAIPKEGTLFNRIKGVVPTVRAVHLPNSGAGRLP